MGVRAALIRTVWQFGLAMIVVLVIGVLLRKAWPTPTERFIAAALSQGWTSDHLRPIVSEVLAVLLRPGEFAAPPTINAEPRADAVNVYLVRYPTGSIRPAIRNRFPDYVGTIAYLGESNAILVDEEYLEALGERLGFLIDGDAEANPYVRLKNNEQGMRFLLLWVLGHELGHLVAAHGGRHFGPAGPEKPVDHDSLGYRQELEADQALAERLSRAMHVNAVSADDITSFGTFMAVLLEAELSRVMGVPRKQGPLIQLFDPNLTQLLRPAVHPDYFLRATRLMALLDLPPSSPLRVVQEGARRLEGRLQPITSTAGRVVVDSTPPGAIMSIKGAGTQLPNYRLPADVWLPPGTYNVNISAPDYESQSHVIVIQANAIKQQHIALVPARAASPEGPLPLSAWLSADRHMTNAGHYYWTRQWPEAAAWELNRARELLPTWSRPVLLLAQIAADRNDLAGARVLFARALDLYSKEPSWQRGSRGNIQDLANAFHTLLQSDQQSPDRPEQVLALVESLWRVDEDARAEQYLAELRPAHEADARVWLSLARIRVDQSRLDEAESAARRAVNCDGSGTTERFYLATILEQQGRTRDAEAELAAIVQAAPQNAEAVEALAALRFRIGRFADAAEAYRRALTVDADRSWLWCGLGETYRKMHEFDRAEQAYRSEGASPSLVCVTGLVQLHIAARRIQDAIELCTSLAEQSHDDSDRLGVTSVSAICTRAARKRRRRKMPTGGPYGSTRQTPPCGRCSPRPKRQRVKPIGPNCIARLPIGFPAESVLRRYRRRCCGKAGSVAPCFQNQMWCAVARLHSPLH
jgi:tetratricopeptide (TPR) repeat protein